MMWKSGDAPQTELNFDAIYATMFKFTQGDSSLTSESISHAWLLLDRERPIAEQAAFMYATAKQHCLDVWKKQKKINLREVREYHSDNDFDEEEFRESYIDSFADVEDIRTERDILLEIARSAPPKLVRPILVVVSQIFNDSFFVREPNRKIAGSLTGLEESVRQKLRNAGIKSEYGMSECSRLVVAWLKEHCRLW